MQRLRGLFIGASLATLASAGFAGSSSSFFEVRIVLHNPLAVVEAPATPVPPVTPAPPTSPAPGTPPGSGGTLPNPPVVGGGGNPPAPPAPPGGIATPTLPPVTGGGGNVPTLPGPAPGTPPVAGGGPSVPVVTPGRPAIAVTTANGGICTSQTFSDATNATVRVLCSTGQFVSIEPIPGRPFAGTHGGAYRYNFGPSHRLSVGLGDSAQLYIGTGTVTALRIMNLQGSEAPLEMLVSF